MKTLSELKNKKFEVKRTIYSMSIDDQIELIKKRLQPENYCGEYAKHNEITCTIEDNKIMATASVFYIYDVSTPDPSIIQFEYENFTSQRIEKINRYLLTFKNVKIPCPLYPEKQEKSNGIIEIKSSGAYVFNGWHGEAIKASDLIKNDAGDIIGFKKMTYKNELIKYEIIGV